MLAIVPNLGPFELIIPTIGPFELIIILVVVVIIFGVGRLPEIGGALGKGIREFRSSSRDNENEPEQLNSEAKEQPTPTERTDKGGTVRH